MGGILLIATVVALICALDAHRRLDKHIKETDQYKKEIRDNAEKIHDDFDSRLRNFDRILNHRFPQNRR